MTATYIALFLFGTIIGSFLNALLFRFNTGRGMGGRSACMSCGKTLGALELIPILSYLFLRGKCSACQSKISLQYPLVELAAGLIAIACYRLFVSDVPLFTLSFVIWMLLLFVAVYDLRHKIIPDSCAVLLGVLGFVSLWLAGFSAQAFIAGPLLALPLFALSFFSKGRAMGWGDGKLMVGLGWFLGLSKGFAALLFSFWIGLIVSLALLMLPLNSRSGRLTMKSEIPYAPFLILGAAAAYFTEAASFVLGAIF